MDEQYTLVHFAKRSSVLALGEKSVARCEDGLLALAMIDESRIDGRDAAWALGLLAHAMEETGADRQRLVKQAATLATPGMSTLPDRSDGRLAAVGLGLRADRSRERRRPGPVGLRALRARGRPDRARPAPGGDGAARPIRRGPRDRDGPARRLVPEGAPLERGAAVEEGAQRRRRATGTVRRAHTENPSAQMLVQWAAEMPRAEEDANALAEYAGANRSTGSHFVIGEAHGRLFSLLVAGSSFEGVAPFESPETLAAIAKETRPLLEEAAR